MSDYFKLGFPPEDKMTAAISGLTSEKHKIQKKKVCGDPLEAFIKEKENEVILGPFMSYSRWPISNLLELVYLNQSL